MERRKVVLPITEQAFSGTRILALRAIQKRFRRNDQPRNVVQEVGRDPLRVPKDTPPGEVIDVARGLAAAKKQLETVLPQATRADNLTHIDDFGE